MPKKRATEASKESTLASTSYKLILAASILSYIYLLYYAINHEPDYINDFFIVTAAIIILYYYRKELHLNPIVFTMFGSFLFLHNAGVFGWYNLYPLGIEYDVYVHFYFGIIAGLMVVPALANKINLPRWMVPIFLFVLVLGFSTIHELTEFAGATILGEGEGLLLIGAGDLDPWDTQKDMCFNLLGALIGMSASYAFLLRKRTYQ